MSTRQPLATAVSVRVFVRTTTPCSYHAIVLSHSVGRTFVSGTLMPVGFGADPSSVSRLSPQRSPWQRRSTTVGLPFAPRPMSASNGFGWVATLSGCGAEPEVEATSLYADPSLHGEDRDTAIRVDVHVPCLGASTRSSARATVGIASATKAIAKKMRT